MDDKQMLEWVAEHVTELLIGIGSSHIKYIDDNGMIQEDIILHDDELPVNILKKFVVKITKKEYKITA